MAYRAAMLSSRCQRRKERREHAPGRVITRRDGMKWPRRGQKGADRQLCLRPAAMPTAHAPRTEGPALAGTDVKVRPHRGHADSAFPGDVPRNCAKRFRETPEAAHQPPSRYARNHGTGRTRHTRQPCPRQTGAFPSSTGDAAHTADESTVSADDLQFHLWRRTWPRQPSRHARYPPSSCPPPRPLASGASPRLESRP